MTEPTYTITIPQGVQLEKRVEARLLLRQKVFPIWMAEKVVLSITSARKPGMPEDCPDFALYRGHNYIPYKVQGFYKDGSSRVISKLNTELMSFDEDGEYRYKVIPSRWSRSPALIGATLPSSSTLWKRKVR